MVVNLISPEKLIQTVNEEYVSVDIHRLFSDDSISLESKGVLLTMLAYSNEKTSFTMDDLLDSSANTNELDTFRCIKQLEQSGYVTVSRQGVKTL